jgi:hypothetical protein
VPLIALEEHYAWDFVTSYPMDAHARRLVECENAIRLFGDKIPARLREAAS